MAANQNQAQILAIQPNGTPLLNISARPISSFVAASTQTAQVNLVGTLGLGPVDFQQLPRTSSGCVSSNVVGGGARVTENSRNSSCILAGSSAGRSSSKKTQDLREFSLEIYDKKY